MNRKNESPAGPTDEPESPGEPGWLGEIEQRLKRARPRRPRLDAAALIERAAAPSADFAAARPAQADRRRARRAGRFYRRVAIAAGSWACGAVAGALAMFLFLTSRTEADPLRPVPVAERNTELPVRESTAQVAAPRVEEEIESAAPLVTSSPPKKAKPLDGRAARLATLADPLDGRSAYRSPTSALRAGMSVGPLAGRGPDGSEQMAAAIGKNRGEPGPAPFEAAADPLSPFVPQAETTREQLLDDVLREITL